jgi:N-acetyl-gamma-glutamyl-phosphate reductase
MPLIRSDEVSSSEVDIAFFCLPHALCMEPVQLARKAGTRVVDLSADFRLIDPTVYEEWYHTPHTATDCLAEAVYGLPEIHRERIRGASLIANPGCYPTSVLLGLYPLASRRLIAEDAIIVDAKSGVSGAGRKPSLTTHFVEVNEDVRPYSVGHSHRHVPEMEQELADLLGRPTRVTFSPHLIPVNRGIVSTIYVRTTVGAGNLHDLYTDAYAGEPFVRVVPPGDLARLKHVVGTNLCAISVTELADGRAIIVSAIDNLLKGASGQAVQNMNLLFGLDETLGLAGAGG